MKDLRFRGIADYFVRLEWNLSDLWIGLYFDVKTFSVVHHANMAQVESRATFQCRVMEYDFFFCLIPCLPLHLHFRHVKNYLI